MPTLLDHRDRPPTRGRVPGGHNALPSGDARTGRPIRPPSAPAVRHSDVLAALVAFTVLLVGTWVRMGGVADLLAGGATTWESITRLSGLIGSGLGLLGLVLVARPRSLERRYGLDRLFIAHRVLGESMAIAVALHVGAAVVAAAGIGGLVAAIRDLTGGIPWMAAATVGAGLVGVVTITSLKAVRRLLAYETWWGLHLTAYLGLALAFAHTVTLGTDLVNPGVRWAWIAVHVAVVAALLWGRWLRTFVAAARPLRLADRRMVGDDAVELTLAGPALAGMTGEAGQFVILRALTRTLWWQTNPFSLSAAPAVDGLRITVRDRGDASSRLTRLPIGTRIAVEGPFGTITPEAFLRRRPVMIVGGIGVAPIKALLERLPAGSRPVVLIRARSEGEAYHLDEIRALAQARGGHVSALLGRTHLLAGGDPFAPAALRRAIGGDMTQVSAVLCGPESLLGAARSGLRAAGVPTSHIHAEQPWW